MYDAQAAADDHFQQMRDAHAEDEEERRMRREHERQAACDHPHIETWAVRTGVCQSSIVQRGECTTCGKQFG